MGRAGCLQEVASGQCLEIMKTSLIKERCEELPRQKPGGLVSGADEKGLDARGREAVWGPRQTLRPGDRAFGIIKYLGFVPLSGFEIEFDY